MIVEARDISKRYGRHWALARLSFQLAAGESLLLTGHNGSGKSTLLRLVATSLTPSAGTLKVFGLDAKQGAAQIRARVGLVGHASYLYEDLTALQNLRLLGDLLGIGGSRDYATALLERVGLADKAHQSVRAFSAGMRKRLAVARLLLKSPELALLDEPFGELDPAGIALMEGIIRELLAKGAAVIVATHLVDHGLTLCKRRLHLASGRAEAA